VTALSVRRTASSTTADCPTASVNSRPRGIFSPDGVATLLPQAAMARLAAITQENITVTPFRRRRP
jgi:hypothetical protein